MVDVNTSGVQKIVICRLKMSRTGQRLRNKNDKIRVGWDELFFDLSLVLAVKNLADQMAEVS